MNTLVIGVGTGRCGTKSLTRLLSFQKSTFSTHERFGSQVRWDCPSNLWPYRLWLDTERNERDIVADTHFVWTSHIGTFLEWGNNDDRKVRIVALKRDVDEVVDSYDKWKPNSDHWSFHGYRDTKPDQWDKCYPCFDVDSKKKGIRRFWYRVYNIIDQYRSDSRIKLFKTRDLNTEEGVKDILEFVGYEDPNLEVGVKVKAPSYPGPK